jgi:hypothetical protein
MPILAQSPPVASVLMILAEALETEHTNKKTASAKNVNIFLFGMIFKI